MENTASFDLIVIGGGPGGYVASIRAAQLGLKTACIEKAKTLGGTCLNVGCIPAKALLDSSEHYAQAKTKLSKHGVVIPEVSFDLPQMMKRKEAVVRQLTTGVAGLFKKNKVEWIAGSGKLLKSSGSSQQVEVQTATGVRVLNAPKVLLATGSEPSALPFLPFDGKRVISSTEALSLSAVPRHLAVIGGGAIGLELGSVWSRLGARVTIIEFKDRLVPLMDAQLSQELKKSLLRQGFEIKLSTKCLGAKEVGDGLALEVEDIATATKSTIECDVILVATGRKPYSKDLGLENVGIKTDPAGRVPVNPHYESVAPGIFAIGDLIQGPMLAHKAEEEGVAAAEAISGKEAHVNYQVIPSVVYTWPEVASVGATEEELKNAGVTYRMGSFPFMANGRAKAMDETEGFVKILADATTDLILGVHILGAHASTLISEGAIAMELGATAKQLAHSCHAHPTLPEITKEAALAVHQRAIHI